MKAIGMRFLTATAMLYSLVCAGAKAQQSNEQYYQEQQQQQQQAHAAEMNRQGYMQQQNRYGDDQAHTSGDAPMPAPAMSMSEAMDILGKPPQTYGPAADARRKSGRDAGATSPETGTESDPPEN